MAKRGMEIIALLLCLCLCVLPVGVFAASTTEASEPISPEQACTLTISYRYEETAFFDLPVQLYRIAQVSADYQYTLTPAFAQTGLVLNGIKSAGEWNVLRSTLEAQILAGDLEPDYETATDQDGKAHFEGLKPGLYLVMAQTGTHEQLHCYFDSSLIALPGLDDQGLWQYEVQVSTKPELLPPPGEELEYKVLKLWKGDNGTGRPKSVEVEIFRDGVSYQKVTLSQENNWSYSWKAQDDGAKWTVTERNVPKGYTMTVEKREASFTVTNTKPSEPTEPPKTGDTSNIMLYTVLMFVSGGALIVLALLGKRRRS